MEPGTIGSARRRRLSSAWLAYAGVAALLVTAVGTELATERYGAPSFVASVAVVASLLQQPLLMYGVAGVGIALICARILTDTGAQQRPSGSQLSVWGVYIGAWALAALLGSKAGAEPTAIVSAAAVLAVAALGRAALTRREAQNLLYGASRALVLASLMAALLAPDRAYAPHEIWPGGWWPQQDRLQGVLPHPNTAGWVAAVALFMEVAGRSHRVAPRLLMIGAAGFLLIQTGSRTATITLFLGMSIVWLLRQQEQGRSRALLSSWAALAVVATVSCWLVWSGFTIETFNGRSITWGEAWAAFVQSPVIGSGPSAYLDPISQVSFVAYAHNQFLQTAAEMGLLGVAALAAHARYLVKFVAIHRSTLGIALVTMWFATWVSENLIRFAAYSFVLQIVVFQLALYLSASQAEQNREGGNPD